MQFITRTVTTYISGKLSECCSFFAPTAGGWSVTWLQCCGVRGLGTKLTEGWVCPRSGLVAAAPLPAPTHTQLHHSITKTVHTDKRRLTTEIRSEKCVVRRFRRCANVYLHKPRQYSIAYCTPRLYGIAYCS